LVLDDVKGGRLFVMKRAQPAIFTALTGQPHALADQVGERHPRPQLVEKAGRKGHPRLPLARLREREGPIAERWEGEGKAVAATLTRLAPDGAIHPLPHAGEGLTAPEPRHPSSRLTAAPALAMSRTPAWRSRSRAMTLPMSLMPAAPDSAIAALAADSVPASSSCCGRKLSMTVISSASCCANSGRLP